MGDGWDKGPAPFVFTGSHSAQGHRFGIVVSRFHQAVTEGLLREAVAELVELGANPREIHVAKVPGAFEIPMAAKKMALAGKYDAVICLGAVVRGETPHFEYISAEVSRGVADIALQTGVPILYGVLTVDTLRQALERSGVKSAGRKKGKGEADLNRGRQTARAAVEMASLMKQIPPA